MKKVHNIVEEWPSLNSLLIGSTAKFIMIISIGIFYFPRVNNSLYAA